MKQSKLEQYIDILKLFKYNGPLTLTQVINIANVKSIILKEQIDFLVKHGLIEKLTVKKSRAVFAVTHRGTNVMEYFQEFIILPSLEEA